MVNTPSINSGSSKADEYARFVKNMVTPESDLFQSVEYFFSATKQVKPGISSITIDKDGNFDVETAEFQDLSKSLDLKEGQRRILLIENISADVAKTVVGHLDLDPQFFYGHIHAISLETADGGMRSDPMSWFCMKKVYADLPALNSIKSQADYAHFRFVGARELQDNRKVPRHEKLMERINTDPAKTNVARIAGLFVPVHRSNVAFPSVVMARRLISVWFGKPDSFGDWTIGLILLDPSFKISKKDQYTGLKVQNSVYRSFLAGPKMGNSVKDSRTSHQATLLQYIKSMGRLENKDALFLVLQGALRIVASEWIATNAYIERDLNTIEWRIETESTSISVFEDFLAQLFIARRRIRKYQELVEDQLDLFNTKCMLPASWGVINDRIRHEIVGDFKQVQLIVERNSRRVVQTIDLITSIMSVREGQQSMHLNLQLGFLSLIATLSLPLSVLAGYFGMSTKYAHGGDLNGIFWKTAGISIGIIISTAISVRLFIWFDLHRRIPLKITGIMKSSRKSRTEWRVRARYTP